MNTTLGGGGESHTLQLKMEMTGLSPRQQNLRRVSVLVEDKIQVSGDLPFNKISTNNIVDVIHHSKFGRLR